MTDLSKNDVTWARRITERLRVQATNYAEAREKVIATMTEARDGGAADLLGYASWTAYMADVFGDAPLRLERDARQELVAELSAQGMSTRAIAPIVGVSVSTVKTDVQQVASSGHLPADSRPLTSDEVERTFFADNTPDVSDITVDAATGEVTEPAEPVQTVTEHTVTEKTKTITGLDGKAYTAPAAKKPNRRAITDTARDAGWDLRKITEKILRIREDDRFSRNKNEVATHLRSHLVFAIESLTGLLDDLNQSQED